MQQKLIGAFLAVVLLLVTALPAAAGDTITDVSSDHWAYESVREMIDRGYLSLYDQSEFRGETEVTRYQLAEIVDQLIDKVEQEQVALNEEELLTLKNLATEFRTELVEVMSKSENLEEKVEEINNGQKILEEDIVETNDRLNELQREFNDIVEDLNERALEIKELREKVDQLEQRNQSLNERVEGLENRLEAEAADTATDEQIASLNEEVETLRSRLYWFGAGSSILLLSILAAN